MTDPGLQQPTNDNFLFPDSDLHINTCNTLQDDHWSFFSIKRFFYNLVIYGYLFSLRLIRNINYLDIKVFELYSSYKHFKFYLNRVQINSTK